MVNPRRNAFLTFSPASLPRFRSFDLHWRVHFDEIEKLGDIPVPHPHATVARGLADQLLVVGSVNVNVASEGVRVVLLQTIQPENPRHHEILCLEHFFGNIDDLPALKCTRGREIVADLFRNPKSAERSL